MSRRSRILLFILGFAILAWVLYKFDLKTVIVQLRAFRGYFALIIFLSIIKNFVRTLAWKMSLGTAEPKPGFFLLFWARLAGESVAYLSSGNVFVGEPLKVMLVRDKLHLETGITSVLLERTIYSFTAILVLLSGLLYALTRFSVSESTGLLAILFSIVLGVVISLGLYAFLQEMPVLSWGLGVARKLPLIGRRLSQRHVEGVLIVEKQLYDYRHNHPKRFYLVFALDLLFNLMTVLEVFIIFKGLGAMITYPEALLVEALTKAGNLIFFIPAGIGTYEAITIVLARMLNLNSQIGLMVALIRRFSTFFWVTLGFIAFLSFGRRTKTQDNYKIM
jgi:glycosyltransferase 2 family protein